MNEITVPDNGACTIGRSPFGSMTINHYCFQDSDMLSQHVYLEDYPETGQVKMSRLDDEIVFDTFILMQEPMLFHMYLPRKNNLAILKIGQSYLMIHKQSEWRIDVVAGPESQVGKGRMLSKGREIIIGKLLLHDDDLVQDGHAQICYTDRGIEVQPINGDVFYMAREEEYLCYGDILLLGQTFISLNFEYSC